MIRLQANTTSPFKQNSLGSAFAAASPTESRQNFYAVTTRIATLITQARVLRRADLVTALTQARSNLIAALNVAVDLTAQARFGTVLQTWAAKFADPNVSVFLKDSSQYVEDYLTRLQDAIKALNTANQQDSTLDRYSHADADSFYHLANTELAVEIFSDQTTVSGAKQRDPNFKPCIKVGNLTGLKGVTIQWGVFSADRPPKIFPFQLVVEEDGNTIRVFRAQDKQIAGIGIVFEKTQTDGIFQIARYQAGLREDFQAEWIAAALRTLSEEHPQLYVSRTLTQTELAQLREIAEAIHLHCVDDSWRKESRGSRIHMQEL